MYVVQNGNVPSLHNSNSSQWMEIQRNTFKNWVNEQLKSRGLSIFDLRTDFADGTLLVALVEILQRKKLSGTVQNPVHNQEKLLNITIALDAVVNDYVTLINIDSSHITEGNTKLILALIWQLVLRYQIGLSHFQHQSWLLAWVQAVIPDCRVSNLSSAWNSGIALQALLEFCKTGLYPNWMSTDPSNRVNNCREAMQTARQHFGIPLILRPEDLADSNLDELSAITYISYFTKVGAPGYNATLQRIQPLVMNYPVDNFTTDWKDGRVLCELVYVHGGSISSWPDLKGTNIERITEGIEGANKIGVEQLLSATEIAAETSEHLGIMAYAARFFRLTPSVVTYDRTYKESKIKRVGVYVTGASEASKNTTLHSSIDNMANEKRRGSSSSSDPDDSGTKRKLKYDLVRTPSIRKRQNRPVQASEGVKKDTYSDGIIIYATSHALVAPDDVKLEAESPIGRIIKMNGDGMYHAQFGFDEIGTWVVTLKLNDKIMESCKVHVCDPSQVKVSGLKAGMAGNQHNFTIDCLNAGQGKLEVDITMNGKNVPTYIKETETRVYSIGFTPLIAGNYKIAIAYNKAEIRDDVLSVPHEEELHRQAIFSTAIKPHHDHYTITANCDWQIDYMTGGPIDLYIDDTADVRVYSLQDGTVCNVPYFIADATNAPPGGTLAATVTYEGMKYPAEVEEDKPGIHKVVFKPRGPGEYKLWITYDRKLLKGAPFVQVIAELTSPTAEGPGLHKGVVSIPADFNVDARGFPGRLTAEVQGPHFEANTVIKTNPDGTHTVTYIPEEIGIYRVHIKLDGKDIEGSPFHPKIVDPKKVRVSGGWDPLMDDQGRIPLQLGKEKHIPFDASEAGPGELTSNVHGPSGNVPVTIDSLGDGKNTLIFTPKQEGKHYIDVFWNGFPLPKSPYTGYAILALKEPEVNIPKVIHVNEEEPVLLRNDSVHRKPSSRNSEPPEGYWVRADKPHSSDDGPHKVYILAPAKSESHIPSAMSTRVDPPRVQVYRRGSDSSDTPRQHLQPKRPDGVYSTSTLPSTKSEPKKKEPDAVLTRLPRTSPTSHYDPVYNSDSYIYQTSPQSSSPPSESPSYIYAKPHKPSHADTKDPSHKVNLKGRGLKEADVDKPAVFTIDGRDAGPGEPEARIRSIKSELPIEISPTGPKQYKCTYTPRVPGAYLLDIKWNSKPLKCCPFKVDVRKPVYPEKVGVTGPHLKSVPLGNDIDLKIDPRDAGHGELTINCKDPDGLDSPIQLTDNFDGTYRIRVKPVKPGKYILSIQMNKQHVFGSPFAIECLRQLPKNTPILPVKVWGPGLSNGVIPEYQGNFFVDATGAGGGELHVSIMGPKGAFHVEMKRASQKDRLFHCLYNPVEPGSYTINVQWSGKHVNGSPFTIFVAGSEMELLEYEDQRNSGNLSLSTMPVNMLY